MGPGAAGRGDRLAEVLVDGERGAAPVLGELLQHVELVVADVVVGEHDDGEQLERGHVLTVGGRVDGDPLVELGEPLLHHVAP